MNITDFRDTQKQFLEINHRDNRITFVFTANMLMLTAFSSFGDLDFTVTMDTRETNALKDALAHFFDESDGRTTFNYDKETFNSPTAPELSISTTNWESLLKKVWLSHVAQVTVMMNLVFLLAPVSRGNPALPRCATPALTSDTFSWSPSAGGLYKKVSINV